jgi:hypothetical protein
MIASYRLGEQDAGSMHASASEGFEKTAVYS